MMTMVMKHGVMVLFNWTTEVS